MAIPPCPLPVVAMSTPSITGHRLAIVQSPYDIGCFASHSWQLQLPPQTMMPMKTFTPTRREHRLQNKKLFSWICSCGTANFNHESTICQWCGQAAAHLALATVTCQAVAEVTGDSPVRKESSVEPWICACGTPNYLHSCSACHWCGQDKSDIARDDASDATTDVGSILDLEVLPRCVKVSGLPEVSAARWSYEALVDLLHLADCAVSCIFVQTHGDGLTCNAIAFVFFSDTASVHTALTHDGSAFGANGDLLAMSLVDCSACDTIAEDIVKTLELNLKSCSPWSRPSVAQLLTMVHSRRDFMFLSMLELKERLHAGGQTLKWKIDSWIESFVSVSVDEYNTNADGTSGWNIPVQFSFPMGARDVTHIPQPKQPLGMTVVEALRAGRTPDELKKAGLSSSTIQIAMKIRKGELRSGPHARNPSPRVSTLPANPSPQVSTLPADGRPDENRQDANKTFHTVDIRYDIRQHSNKTSDVADDLNHGSAHDQIIGEFIGRVKPPASGQTRFKGKALFCLVVCHGKELKRLQDVATAHGWVWEDLDIFVHKNDWDATVQQRLYPDEKVKVKLVAPCADSSRLKAVSLVKIPEKQC